MKAAEQAGDRAREALALARLVDRMAERAGGRDEPRPGDGETLGLVAREGGAPVAERRADLLVLDALRRAARGPEGAAIPSAQPSHDPLARAVANALSAIASIEETRSPAAQDDLLAALGRLREAAAFDPLASLLLIAAARLASVSPDWCDAAVSEAIRLLQEAARASDVVRALLVRARLALARDSFSAALRSLEAATRVARDEGLDESASEIVALRAAVDSALAGGGGGKLASIFELNELIRAIRLVSDPEAALRRIVDAVVDWTGGDAALLLLEGGGAEAPWAVFHASAEHAVDRAPFLAVGERVARVVAAEGGRPFASTAPAGDQRLAAGPDAPSGVGALIAAPLIVEGRVGGVLVAARSPERGPFPREALPFLTALSTLGSSIAADRRGEAVRHENVRLRQKLGLTDGFEGILTQNARMLQLIDTLKRAAAGSTTILLQGETGTGKELLARAIHQHGSATRSGSFVTVSCAELTHELLESELFGHVRGSFTGAVEEKKGLFRIADGGTVFLDEIDKTDRNFQETLLRVVDRREIKPVGATESSLIDVRIICASNVELRRSVEEGRFLKDLYYRLRVIAITIPPLRERSEDIPLLAEHFRGLASRRLGRSVRAFAPETMKRLVAHVGPGNVRDLENEVERLVALTPDDEEIQPRSLSAEVAGAALTPEVAHAPNRSLAAILEEVERNLVLNTLLACRGNRSKAARRLGLSRRGLLNKVDRFGLHDVGRTGA
jgi:DNA-binding NtrC family response regulator